MAGRTSTANTACGPGRTDGRLVDVIYRGLHHLEDTPVLKLSRRAIAIEVADAVWAWLAEGDIESPLGESRSTGATTDPTTQETGGSDAESRT